jgi:hypothetical protein
MGSNVVPGYNPILFAGDEATLGTYVAPADVAAFAASAIATVQADMGDMMTPETRGKQDRGLARDMQDGFVSGRYTAPAWSVMTSLKSRADADDAPRELALWKATGFGRTVNASTSYVLAPTNTPVESADFVPQSFTRVLGRSPGEMEVERLLGCFAEKVRIEGGDKEVMATFSGKAQSKGVGTAIASASVADDSTTSVTVSAAESYAFTAGYYQWESEIILVSAPTYGGTSITIARGQLGSTAAAHSSKPVYPYIPTGISYGGAPISEALTTTFTFDGGAFRVLNWAVDITTGLQALPGETGSAFAFQGVKATRVDVQPSLNFILKGDDVRKFNKARERTDMAVSIVQGTTAGGIITLSFGHCELVAPKAQDNANDTVNVAATLRVRGSGAATPDSFAITLT